MLYRPRPLAGFQSCDFVGGKSLVVGLAVRLTGRQCEGVVKAACLLAEFNAWRKRSRNEGGAVINHEPIRRVLVSLFFQLPNQVQLRQRTRSHAPTVPCAASARGAG